MNIAFFGSSLVSAYWNGAATYYRGIIRALHGLGHQVTFYEPDAYERQSHRDIADPFWSRVVVYPAAEEAVMKQVEAARGADVIVKASGVGVFDELLECAVVSLKKPSNVVLFWDVDAPATLERLEENPDDSFRELIPRFDLILTYGGGAPVMDAYTRLGARDCIPIYNALDPMTHFPVPPNLQFNCTLAFLGNRLPDREARADEFFFKAACLIPEAPFILGGNGWEDKAVQSNIRKIGHVFTRDHNAFNSTPMAVLNVSRESMARYGFSPATRLFEAAGAGACLISDHWTGMAQFLDPDSEVLVARDGEEVVNHLEALLPQRARDIGLAARRRVLAEHTYEHRAAQLDALLEARDTLAGIP